MACAGRLPQRGAAVAARPAGAGRAGADVRRERGAHRGAGAAGRRAGLAGRAAARPHAPAPALAPRQGTRAPPRRCSAQSPNINAVSLCLTAE